MSQTAAPAHKRSTLRRHLLYPILLLLIASLACSLPNLSRSTPVSPANTAAPVVEAQTPGEATKPVPQAALPPGLVEVEPQPGSALASGTAPVFYFNQSMERGSVESSTKSTVDGRLEWLDDATVRFVPSQPLSPDIALNVTINTGARAANGLALPQPITVGYQAAGLLRAAQKLPSPGAEQVNPSSAVVITFTQPVVPLGADMQNAPAAFSLDPQAGGRGEWLNTSTYIFYPDPALQGGQQYAVRVDPNLKSVDGSPFDASGSGDWTFSTAAPALTAMQPGTDRPILLDDVFVLTFNQPMDAASVQENFSLLTRDGVVVDGDFTWNEAQSELTFTPRVLLQRAMVYNLVLFGSARSKGGAVIGQDFAATVSTVPQFSVVETRPSTGAQLESYQGYGSVALAFSSPVAAGQSFSQLIDIDPPVTSQSVTRSYDGLWIYVSGYFKPSTSYSLTVSPGLRDRWDSTLGLPFSLTFTTQPAKPILTIPIRQLGSQALYVPQLDTSIPAYAVNITRLELARGRLNLAEFIEAEQHWEGLENWESKVNSRWVRLLYPDRDVTETIQLPLSQAGDPLDAGLYFLNYVTTPLQDNFTARSPLLLVVSPLQITLKVANHQAFVWVVKTSDRQPLANRQVDFYDQSARLLASCTTDVQGICQADLPSLDSGASVYAVTGQPGDIEFGLAASGWYQGVAPWEMRIPYEKDTDLPEVYLYTDRPIYRPGQTVHFRAVVRGEENGRYFNPDVSDLSISVVSPYDPVSYVFRVLSTMNLPLSPYGTVEGIYELPADADPGTYSLNIEGARQSGISFQVADYRKPEIDLAVKFVKEEDLLGEALQAEVSARYFFGAPAGNLPVRWTLFGRRSFPDLPDGLDTGPVNLERFFSWDRSEWAETYLLDGAAQTSPDGTVMINISGSDLQEILSYRGDYTFDLTLEVVVEDESGLPVAVRAGMQLHPSLDYIGVRQEKWSVQAGEETTFYIRTVGWQGEPRAEMPLSARFRRIEWVEQEILDPSSPPELKPEYIDVGSTNFITSASGEARLAFTPPDPGTYQLSVSGEDGTLTELVIWVSGMGAAGWPDLSSQRLQLHSDLERYQPGDTARVFIPNPFEGGATALVTVERDRVMRSQVIEIDGASYELELPLGEEDAPNVYVSVVLLGRTNGKPDFRAGYQELTVDPAALLLQVEVETTPQQARPGEEAEITIRVKDAAGQPVQGEFSLALVDKAVLALADPNSRPIGDAFYGRQPVGVLSSYSLVVYGGRFLYVPPEQGRGGGGGDMVVPPPARSKFEDTAFWSGTIETDDSGAAVVRVVLPDNLTTWRADVRGVTEDTLVGQAQVDLVTSKPLLVRPVAPRFAVVGDHLELAALVHNNTGQAVQASVRLEANGFAFDDAGQAEQTVEVGANGQARVSWWGTVQDAEALDLVFTAEGGGLEDATRPEMGSIPILRYTSPQTFGTAGLLDGQGERLELVSLPRSFTPAGGELRVEVSPSLAATVMEELQAVENFPRDITEPLLSRLLPNLAAFQMINDFSLEDQLERSVLQYAVAESIDRLERMQNENGGWGWSSGYHSEPHISAYVLFGLNRANQVGFPVESLVLQRGRDFLSGQLLPPSIKMAGWQLNRLAFQMYVLQQMGYNDLNVSGLYEYRDKLSPWGKAFLALAMNGLQPSDSRAATLLSDLQASADRSATGTHWQEDQAGWQNWSTAGFTTSVVAYAIAQMDPSSPLLVDAARYLVMNRQGSGGWRSSYETAWALFALVETARSTSDLQPAYSYSVNLNGAALAQGQVNGPDQAAQTASAIVGIDQLNADAPNGLLFERSEGSGRLYYRAYLSVTRPVEDAPSVQRGITITRQYYRSGQDCRVEECQPLTEIDLADPQPVLVRLTLTVPTDMYYVVVEDSFPAGADVLNPRLKTSQQFTVPEEGQEAPPQYALDNPFEEGWGWWIFKDPQVYDDHVRWMVDTLPAGTYELTYRLTPYLAGDFRLLPARAWQYYFPEVEGASAGSVLTIR